MLSTPLGLCRQIFADRLHSLFDSDGGVAKFPIEAINTERGLALEGYDPVSYFEVGGAIQGTAAFTLRYKGAVYRFASAAHRERFTAEPQRFLPQYGGYCALAIAFNRIADIDPQYWDIVKDRLYLNNGILAETLWSLNKAGNIRRGDQNWPLVSKRGSA